LALAAGEVGRPAVRVYRLVAAKAALAAWLGQQPLPGEEPEEALERPRDANTAAEDAAHLLTISPTAVLDAAISAADTDPGCHPMNPEEWEAMGARGVDRHPVLINERKGRDEVDSLPS
jgi:hypothetical protein